MLAYLKRSLAVENTPEIKDMIDQYLVNPTVKKSFKKIRAKDLDKRASKLQSEQAFTTMKKQISSQSRRKVFRSLHIKSVRYEMSPEIQRIGYITLKNDLDSTVAKILDFD